MKYFLLSALFGIWLSHSSYCQSYFNKTFGISNSGANGLAVIVLPDSSYLVGGNAGTNFPYKLNTLLASVSQTGDTLWTKLLILPGDETWDAQNMIYDSTLIIEGTWITFTPILDSQQLFAKVTLQGDTLWTLKVGNDTLSDNSGKMIRDSRGDYVCSGWSFDIDDETKERILVSKVSPEGNLILEKRYPELISGYQHYASYTVAETHDKCYILVGSKYPDATPFSPASDIYYIKVDSVGELLWSKQIYNNEGWDAGTDVITFSDGKFIMCGSKSHAISTIVYNQRIWLGMFDGDGNLENENAFSDGEQNYISCNRMIYTSDGYIVVVGGEDSTFNHVKAFILKIDTGLNLKWIRYYKRAYADYLLADLFWDVKETPDKGFIASGRTIETEPDTSQNVWLVKMDSLGCDVPGCDSIGTVVQPLLPMGDEFTVVAFPNPSNDKFYFKYRLPSGVQEAEMLIIDVNGVAVSKIHISNNKGIVSWQAKEFAAGTYFYTTNTRLGQEFSGKIILEK